MKTLLAILLTLATVFGARADQPSYAVYAEFARGSNKLMQPNLNRRVLNVVEAQAGDDIHLNSDGSITLKPGTYRLTGFSLVTMQATFAPPVLKNENNYPGYCLVYPANLEREAPTRLLPGAIAVGSPATAQDTCPSIFEAVYTARSETTIAVGHQSGEDLHDEVYLSVYEVNGIPSDYHVFARIAITRL